ncbi:hypothetical protein AKJ16_DCAP13442 [Drosera capensis]
MGNTRSKYKETSCESCPYRRGASSSSSSNNSTRGHKKSKYKEECESCPYRRGTPSSSSSDDDENPDMMKSVADIVKCVSKTDASARKIGYEIVSKLAKQKTDTNKKGIEVYDMGKVNVYVTCIPNTTRKDDIHVGIVNLKSGRSLTILVWENGNPIIYRTKKVSHEGMICYAEHKNGLLSVAILVGK